MKVYSAEDVYTEELKFFSTEKGVNQFLEDNSHSWVYYSSFELPFKES